MTALPTGGPLGSALEAVAGAAAGGALGGLTWSLIGLGWPAAVVGAANGAISGARRVYGWREPKGVAAFVLDSTWALPMTAAALAVHAIAVVQPGRGGFVAGAEHAGQPPRVRAGVPASAGAS